MIPYSCTIICYVLSTYFSNYLNIMAMWSSDHSSCRRLVWLFCRSSFVYLQTWRTKMQHRTVFQDPRDKSCICCNCCEKFPTSIHPLDTALNVQQNWHVESNLEDEAETWRTRGDDYWKTIMEHHLWWLSDSTIGNHLQQTLSSKQESSPQKLPNNPHLSLSLSWMLQSSPGLQEAMKAAAAELSAMIPCAPLWVRISFIA